MTPTSNIQSGVRRMNLPDAWHSAIGDEIRKPYFHALQDFLASERAKFAVYPAEDHVFRALEVTPYDAVRVVLLGQDPYHDIGQAHGLCFSVQPGVKIPASLRNIFKELKDDMGCTIPTHGCLLSWAEQGVLMLNTVLTVRAHEANSHRGHGWETFTDAIIDQLNQRAEPTLFVLWGKPAQAKKKRIDLAKHATLEAAHPSPLSAHQGFFGSKPFSKINVQLRAWGRSEIDWQIPNDVSDP
jgi:uracil-DNA glycosylase